MPPHAGDRARGASRISSIPHDLLGSFERAAKAVSAEVHRIDGNRVPPELVAELVERYGVQRAVISAEPEAAAVADELRALAVEVEPLSIEAAARADLGVTERDIRARDHGHGRAGVRASPAGARRACLPPVHLCVLPASRLVPSTSAVLRGARRTRAASRATSCSSPGPSRSGDIEQIITLGVHGPTALHIVLLEERRADAGDDVYAPRVPNPQGVLKCASSEQAFWPSPSCSQSPRAATTAGGSSSDTGGGSGGNFGDCDITVDKGELGDVQLTNDGELTVATNLAGARVLERRRSRQHQRRLRVLHGGRHRDEPRPRQGQGRQRVVRRARRRPDRATSTSRSRRSRSPTSARKVVDFSTPYFSADQGVWSTRARRSRTSTRPRRPKWGVQASTTGTDLPRRRRQARQRGRGVPGHAVDVHRADRRSRSTR